LTYVGQHSILFNRLIFFLAALWKDHEKTSIFLNLIGTWRGLTNPGNYLLVFRQFSNDIGTVETPPEKIDKNNSFSLLTVMLPKIRAGKKNSKYVPCD